MIEEEVILFFCTTLIMIGSALEQLSITSQKSKCRWIKLVDYMQQMGRRASSRWRGLKHLGLLDGGALASSTEYGHVAAINGGGHQLDLGVIGSGEVAQGEACAHHRDLPGTRWGATIAERNRVRSSGAGHWLILA